MSGKFLKDVHNRAYFTGTDKPVNSVMYESDALSASAFISASGTTLNQQGRLPLRMAHVPGISAAMIPANQLEPTGWSNLFVITCVGTPYAQIKAWKPENASAQKHQVFGHRKAIHPTIKVFIGKKPPHAALLLRFSANSARIFALNAML